MSEFIEPSRNRIDSEPTTIIKAGGVVLDIARVSADYITEGISAIKHVGSTLTSISVDLLRIDRN